MRIRRWVFLAAALGIVAAAGCGSKAATASKKSGERAGTAGDGADEQEIAEVAKVEKAKYQMRFVEEAIKKYHAEKGQWPDPANLAATIGPLLSMEASLMDPWGGDYTYSVEPGKGEGGEPIERPIVSCSPPGKSPISYPEQ